MLPLTRLLSRLGLRPVTYDHTFFAEPWFREWEGLKLVLAELVESRPRWRRILDFGCGPGVMIDFMTARGHRYVGCDSSPEARDLYLRSFGANPGSYVASLETAVRAEPFDLFLSFDVFEHLTDEQCDGVLRTVAPIPELLVNISRVRGIPGHVNLKSDEGWVSFFGTRGLDLAEEETEALRTLYEKLRPGSPDRWNRNLFVFRRRRAEMGP
jgi:SAM-dependent methyltransferase